MDDSQLLAAEDPTDPAAPGATVAFGLVDQPSRERVARDVAHALEAAGGAGLDLGGRCLVKINAMSREVVPGRNTSPWVLAGVLAWLRDTHPGARLVVADTDVAGFPQFAQACRAWGYDDLARRFGATIVNLAREATMPVARPDSQLGALELPRLVMESDSIVNLPVMKTHVLSGISCCLKNHWGLLPRVRYQFHVRVNEVIAAINRLVPHTLLNLLDGTIAMEGSGPKTGDPKVCGVLVASRDRVACDRAAMEYMALDPALAPHVRLAAELGVGSLEYAWVGDPMVPNPFAPPSLGQDVVSLLERKLRAIPGLGKLLYHPWLAPLLGLVGTKYNEWVWTPRHLPQILDERIMVCPYWPEFEQLLNLAGRLTT